MEIITIIKRMSSENVTWGAPRIVDELALLGHEVAEPTVAKYMVKGTESAQGQGWETFLHNHLAETAACDVFVVPTIRFQNPYCFVVMSLDRRRILHVNVTKHSTAEWAAQQLIEAFPGHGWIARFLQRDRDAIFGCVFRRKLKMLKIEELISAPKSPWQNAYVERLIGSIRRDCTDHIIPLSVKHLLKTNREFASYYNESRTHQSLGGNSPIARKVEAIGEVVSEPVLGGMHHRYSRAA